MGNSADSSLAMDAPHVGAIPCGCPAVRGIVRNVFMLSTIAYIAGRPRGTPLPAMYAMTINAGCCLHRRAQRGTPLPAMYAMIFTAILLLVPAPPVAKGRPAEADTLGCCRGAATRRSP